MNKLLAGVCCEFIGAFALMFAGGAAIISFGDNLVSIALAHGLILGVMVTATMHISGGQLNPAVSTALALIGKQSWGRAVVFIIAQCAGAVAAAFILSRVMPADIVAKVHLGATLGEFSHPDTIGLVFILEAIATFFLMFTVLGSAVDPRGTGGTRAVGGFAIGLAVAADICAIGKWTGASMNPSRSLGPALVGGNWDVHWVYWAAPIAGACAAALLWRFVMEDRTR